MSSQPQGEGQHVNIQTTEIEIKVTPAIIELFSGVAANYSQQQVIIHNY